MADDVEWIAHVELPLVRQRVGARGFELALASPLRYLHPPIVAGGAVRAVLGEETRPFVVALRESSDGELAGQCSQCASEIVPCAHATVLALDLASSPSLREALAEGKDTRAIAEALPDARRAADAERKLDSALRGWLAPAVTGMAVEIAATPFDDARAMGRTYGERADATRPIALYVRRASDRRLLTPREALGTKGFASRDRRVLEYARERGGTKKALYAAGVEAALTLDAMRAHGGVFAGGFKGLLDFRADVVRPAVLFEEGRAGAADSLDAQWTTEDGGTKIAFDACLYFDGPSPYIWAQNGAIFRVAADVDRDVVARLVASPSLRVPQGRRRETGSRILRAMRGRGVTLPPAEVFGVTPIETPRFALRLTGEPLEIEGELVAVYPTHEVSLITKDGIAPEAGGASEEGRDAVLEARARGIVDRAGLVRDGRIDLYGDEAVAFWQDEGGLAALRAESDPAIDVVLSDRLARVRVGGHVSVRVHVTLEGNWLATRLKFDAEDLPLEMSVVRAALARKQRWVALSNGALARISASIESLANEAADVLEGDFGLLPAHQLGRLDRWIEENDGRVDAAVAVLRSKLRALAVAAEPEMPRALRAELRPYQKQGLAWLQFLQALGAGGVLADDMGLGKTITTLAFLLRRKETEGPAPTLVVCPTSVASNWLRESARFTPDFRVLLLQAGMRLPEASVLANHDLVITTYALLRRDIDLLANIPFRCAVLDEAQNVKNAEGATRGAAGRLQASMRLALSGTPIENRLGELWSILSFTNPGILGTASSFETRFERTIASDTTSPLAPVLRAIVRPFLLRRTKRDVLSELPPKTEIDRFVTPTETEQRMYEALAHTLRASLARDVERRDPRVTSLSVFTALTRLRQMACDPRLVDPEAVEPRGAKRETFMALVRELVSEGRRALVFSQFVSLLTLWRRDLEAEAIPYEYLDGSTVGTTREAIVKRFQEGNAPLFLLSLKAGGAGLNLTAADTVIHCDPWWNPAVEDQASDRAHRIGQDKAVTVVRLVARGTIEEKILALKEKKRALTSAIIGDDARALEGITAEDLRALLGETEIEPPEDPTELLATAERAVHPDFGALVARVQRWMAETGRSESELALMLEVPPPIASRLARGEPFPCSRGTAARILARVRDW